MTFASILSEFFYKSQNWLGIFSFVLFDLFVIIERKTGGRYDL